MKVYISADMEGVTGVTHREDVIPGRSRYEGFRKLLTADVNAAIEGAAEGGATEFVVNEAHEEMRNIVLEVLDLRAEVIVGRRKTVFSYPVRDNGGRRRGRRGLLRRLPRRGRDQRRPPPPASVLTEAITNILFPKHAPW